MMYRMSLIFGLLQVQTSEPGQASHNFWTKLLHFHVSLNLVRLVAIVLLIIRSLFSLALGAKSAP